MKISYKTPEVEIISFTSEDIMYNPNIVSAVQNPFSTKMLSEVEEVTLLPE